MGGDVDDVQSAVGSERGSFDQGHAGFGVDLADLGHLLGGAFRGPGDRGGPSAITTTNRSYYNEPQPGRAGSETAMTVDSSTVLAWIAVAALIVYLAMGVGGSVVVALLVMVLRLRTGPRLRASRSRRARMT